jgi:isopentenyl phosphate kinase
MSEKLVFLKLGGSLITDKSRAHTLRPDVLERAAFEIAAAIQADPELKLLLGHGAGSFAHVPADRWKTRQGVRTPDEWRGFLQVWSEADELNRLVLDALQHARVGALAFPPSAGVIAQDGQVFSWDIAPIEAALRSHIVPVVYGDVIFDLERGGTILSTEELFIHLAHQLRPQRLLLAGIEEGVWADYPERTELVREITPQNFGQILSRLQGSAAVDVTGGMESKVRTMLGLVEAIPGLEVQIFAGTESQMIQRALSGVQIGTRIHAADPKGSYG